MIKQTTQLNIDGIARRQLHLFLVVDCSGSMSGDRIASLNYAMRTVLPAIREVSADNPETDMRIAVLRFSTVADWLTPTPQPVDAFEWLDLHAGGETAMGHALGRLAQVLTPTAIPGRQLPPVVVLVTDGQPSDDFEAGLGAFEASPYGGKSTRIAIAIGSDVDHGVLQRFIGHNDYAPLQASNASDLVERIRWATTMPIRARSQSTNDPNPLSTLGKSAPSQSADVGDMVW